jgi:hypothetical protein
MLREMKMSFFKPSSEPLEDKAEDDTPLDEGSKERLKERLPKLLVSYATEVIGELQTCEVSGVIDFCETTENAIIRYSTKRLDRKPTSGDVILETAIAQLHRVFMACSATALFRVAKIAQDTEERIKAIADVGIPETQEENVASAMVDSMLDG